MTTRKLGLGALVSIVLLGLTAVPAAAALQPIDIYAQPWEPAAVVEVTIPPDRTSGSVPVQIFLGQRLPARQDPRFGLSTLAVREPADARVPANPRIRMLVGGRDVTGGGLHPAIRGAWAAELRVEGIDTFGTFEGELLAAIGPNPLSSRVHIVIRRYPAAALAVGGNDGGPLTATATGPTIDLPLDIRNTTITQATAVHLELGAIRAADGTQAAVELVGGAIPTTFAARAAASRTLRVTLPVPGTYEGGITLRWDGSSRELPVRIERVVPTLGVTVLDAQGVVAGEVPWCPRLPGGPDGDCAADALWLAIQETEGREVTLDAPTLESLARHEDGRRIDVPAVTMTTALECVGGPGGQDGAGDTASVGSTSAATDASGVQTCGRASYDTLAGRLTLGANAVARLRLEVAGDLPPGEYVARIALAGAGAVPTGAEAGLALRLPAIVALAALLAGCIIALPLRRPLTIARRQVRRRTRITTILARLEGAVHEAPDLESRGVVLRTQAAAEEVVSGIRARRHRGRQVDRWLDDLETRVDGLDRWLAIWADSVRTSGAIQDRIRSRLTTVARTLSQDERLTDLDRRTLAEIDALGEQLAVPAARQTPIRDPHRRRTDEPTLADEWRWMLSSLRRHVRWSTLVETVALIALTLLAGLTFVWAPDPTWGDPADLAIAAAWAVVVVVVASAALTGLAAIRAQLARPDLG